MRRTRLAGAVSSDMLTSSGKPCVAGGRRSDGVQEAVHEATIGLHTVRRGWGGLRWGGCLYLRGRSYSGHGESIRVTGGTREYGVL